MIEKVCPTCQRTFTVTFRQRKQVYCCRRCVQHPPHTDEWKTKMSLRNTGEGNPFFGKTHKEETRERLSNLHAGKTYEEIMGEEAALALRQLRSKMNSGEGNPFFGRKHKLESRELITLHHMNTSGSNNPMYRQGDKIRGEKNGSWNGGASIGIYAITFTDDLRSLIRKRDKFTCKVCQKRGWDVHHIDYDKMNSDPVNLITLCRSCHMKTNFNRENWIRFFNG